MIDHDTHFDPATDSFTCVLDGTVMEFKRGVFAPADDPNEHLASVIECPKCGHSIAADYPKYVYHYTPSDHPLKGLRYFAAIAADARYEKAKVAKGQGEYFKAAGVTLPNWFFL